MAADVATLSLKLEASQFVDGMARAKAATDGLTTSQRELIARADKLVASANAIDIQNKKAVQTYLQEVAALRATAQQMGVLHLVQETTAKAAADVTTHVVAETQAMKALRIETGLVAAEQKVLGAATGLTAGGLNGLRASAQSLAASLIGTAPGVAQFSGALGTMALGSGLMIGVLAGVAALGFAWDKLTEKARKAKEEHERLIKVLDDLRKKQDQGPAGDIGEATAVRTKDLADQIALVRRLEKEKADLARLGGADVETSGVSRRLTSARAEVINLQDLVRRGNAETAALRKADADQTAQADAQALAARLDYNQKDAAARKAAIELLRKDKVEYAKLLKLPETPENSKEIARIASDMKQLDEALNPKAKSTASRDATQARTIANIAEQEERRVAAAKALFGAAIQGEAAYEREVKSQALKNQLLETEQRIRAQFLDQNGKQKAGTEAAMQAEITRARAAIQAQDELGQKTRATLAIGNDREAVAVLEAKIAAYRGVGVAIADASVEEEYAARMAKAATIADAEQRAEAERLAAAIRDKTQALHRSQEAYAVERKAVQEATREQERAERQRVRATANAIEQVFTDIANRKNPLIALVDGFKSALIRALSEALAQKFLASKFAEMLGIGVEAAAKKQNLAALTMNEASKRQKEAAEMMLRAAGMDPDAPTKEKKAESKVPAWVPQVIRGAVIAAAAGYGGYQAGQAVTSTSHGTAGNIVRGGVAGAVTGAAAGAAVGSVFGVPGALVGGVIGFVSGMFGASKAMKEAAKAAAEMRAALKINMDSLRAEVGKDALAANIAQVEAQRETLRKQIEDAYSGGDKNSATVKERNKQLAELNRLEDERIRQLKEEAAVMQTRQIEDFKVRELRAKGQTKAADDLAFRLSQQREREDLVRSFGTDTDSTEQLILAALDAAQAAERNATALDRNTAALTTLHNAPTGYKVERDIYRFATPAPRPEPKAPIVPTAPTPPQQPVTPPPQLSRAPITLAPVFNIDGTKSSREQVRQIATELRKVVTETLGPAADTSAGWDLLA